MKRKNNRRSGFDYERKIVKELNALGFDVVTSRAESKNLDDDKVDIADKNGKLPCFIQLKKTVNTPQYFAIRDKSSKDNKKFVLIWNKQEKKATNFGSVGEVVLMDKSLFYRFLSDYLTIKNKK